MKIVNDEEVLDINSKIKEVPNLTTIKKCDILLDKTLMPSRGKFYNSDIFVKKFSAKNIKDLSNIQMEQLGQINQIIYKVLTDCVSGIDLNSILTNDKIWLIYYLRDLTYNSMPIKIKSVCPHCEKTTIQEYTLDKLSVTYYDKEFPDKYKLLNGDEVTFRFPTIGTEIQTKRLKNDPQSYDVIDDEFMLLASHIHTINGKSISLYNVYNYVCNLEPMAFSNLVNTISDYYCICERIANFKCSCGETVNEVIGFNQQFFLPKV